MCSSPTTKSKSKSMSDYELMRHTLVLKSYFYLSDQQAEQLAKQCKYTEGEINRMNLELYRRGTADLQYST